MLKNFQQDDWTLTFCLIFKALTQYNKIGKKKDFSAAIGLATPSILNLILNGDRNFPLDSRQHAMKVLRDHYHVNLPFFQSRDNPMFTRSMEEDLLPPVVSTKKGLTFGELSRLKQLEQENETLKKMLSDKDLLIQTQAALIAQLQGDGTEKK